MTIEHEIALIPGDGIGREVLPAGVAVLEAVARRHGLRFSWKEYDWGCPSAAASPSTPASGRGAHAPRGEALHAAVLVPGAASLPRRGVSLLRGGGGHGAGKNV